MKKTDLSDILGLCLDAVLSEQETLDTVLSKYPAQAEALRPELVTALWLRGHSGVAEMRPGYLAASRQRLIRQINETEQTNAATPKIGLTWKLPVFRFAFTLLFFCVAAFSFWGGLTAIQSSLPGESLYQVKLTTEKIQLSWATDTAAEVTLRIRIADQRANEIEALLASGRYENLTPVFDAYQKNLHIAGDLIANMEIGTGQEITLAQQLTEKIATHNQIFQTRLPAQGTAGWPNELSGTIRAVVISNQEVGTTMVVLLNDRGAPAPAFSVSATPTVTPTATTVTATITPTPTPSQTVTSTLTETPAPSKTPAPTQTATASEAPPPTATQETIEEKKPTKTPKDKKPTKTPKDKDKPPKDKDK